MFGVTKGRNAKLVKIHNRALVLRIIQQSDLISRKEIAIRTGLTQATITKIVNLLLEEGLILEIGKDEQGSSFGRKPIALAINKERYNIISLHLGRYSINGAVCNLAGEIVYRKVIFENVLKKADEALIEEVVALIHLLIKNCELCKHSILGIGISTPGTINAEKGIIIGSYAVGQSTGSEREEKPFNWSTLHLRELLEEEFKIPVFADNCSNVSALAESWFGKGRGISNFVQYSIGAGIGSGVIIDGMLYRGEDDVVAEVGHITVDFKGEMCPCGNTGCLELYAGFINLIKAYKRKRSTEDSIGNEGRRFVEDLKLIFNRAASGEKSAEKLIRDHGRLLGIGAVSLANIFSPEYIFVSSNDIGNIDLSMIIEEIRKEVENKAFSVISKKVKVENSALGEDIHLLGGIALVLQDFFNNLASSAAEKNYQVLLENSVG